MFVANRQTLLLARHESLYRPNAFTTVGLWSLPWPIPLQCTPYTYTTCTADRFWSLPWHFPLQLPHILTLPPQQLASGAYSDLYHSNLPHTLTPHAQQIASGAYPDLSHSSVPNILTPHPQQLTSEAYPDLSQPIVPHILEAYSCLFTIQPSLSLPNDVFSPDCHTNLNVSMHVPYRPCVLQTDSWQISNLLVLPLY